MNYDKLSRSLRYYYEKGEKFRPEKLFFLNTTYKLIFLTFVPPGIMQKGEFWNKLKIFKQTLLYIS